MVPELVSGIYQKKGPVRGLSCNMENVNSVLLDYNQIREVRVGGLTVDERNLIALGT